MGAPAPPSHETVTDADGEIAGSVLRELKHYERPLSCRNDSSTQGPLRPRECCSRDADLMSTVGTD